MISHEEKAKALAEKIMKRAEDALASLDREMIIMQWPDDFRAIMWDAVADIAFQLAAIARKQVPGRRAG